MTGWTFPPAGYGPETTRDKLISRLKVDEGFRDKPYKDSRGFLTIGYGWCLDREPMTMDEAEYVLNSKVSRKMIELAQAIPWITDLDEPRQGVLYNMAYQMGVAGVLAFRQTLAMVRAGQYQEAAAEMLNSAWARQTPERAQRLSNQMKDGIWK